MNKRHLICQLEVLIPLTEQAAKIIYKRTVARQGARTKERLAVAELFCIITYTNVDF